MLPRFFAPGIAVANHAESGETLKSFVTELRLDKLLSTLRAGDWVMIQFGHNDQKVQWPQTYAEAATTYRSWLRTYIAEVRRARRDADPRDFARAPQFRRARATSCPASGNIRTPCAPSAARNASRLIDLNAMSRTFLRSAGTRDAPRALRRRRPRQDASQRIRRRTPSRAAWSKAFAPRTRNSPRGLAQHLAADAGRFDPAHPDPP